MPTFAPFGYYIFLSDHDETNFVSFLRHNDKHVYT